jgi:hypothetical protein
MRFVWIASVLVVAIAAAAGAVTYAWLRPVTALESGDDSLQWLRREFALSPDQLARIERVHADYRVVCDRHCADIVAARGALQRLQSTGASDAEIAAARAHAQHIDTECRASLARHVRDVADLIGGEQGRRYLDTVRPLVERFEHGGAPDLRLRPTGAPEQHLHH